MCLGCSTKYHKNNYPVNMMIGYLLRIKLKTCLYVLVIPCVLLIILYQSNFRRNEVRTFANHNKSRDPVVPILLWWTEFVLGDKELTCANNVQCTVTPNRMYFQHPATAAYIFYGSNFSPYDLPVPRKNTDVWAILHEESPKNLALYLHDEAHELFNITSTFSRHSHFPITLQYLASLEALTDRTYFVSTEHKNSLLGQLAPVLYIQSDCVTPLERDSYVAELMRHLPVDSYGKCMNNKRLPDQFTKDPLQHMFSAEFMRFVARYKFTVAFENAVCEDYITEKLWRPLIAGSVPIYLGSPSVQDWLPNNKSVIVASEFASPRALADHLLKLNSDDALYNAHLRHKLTGRVDNQRLVASMRDRHWATDDDSDRVHFIQAYECFVCETVHGRAALHKPAHRPYDCPEPVSPITRERNESNWWTSHWREGRCQAHVLKQFVSDPLRGNFTKDQFDSAVKRLVLQELAQPPVDTYAPVPLWAEAVHDGDGGGGE